jgi:hypothetical protein
MATCPEGHESATTDFCDECGRPIEARPPGSAPSAPSAPDDEREPSSVTAVRRVAPPGEPCPLCHDPRRGTDRYCENDGYDFETAASIEDAAPVELGWHLTVATDRARFDVLHPDDLEFPLDAPVLTWILDAESVSVGRRSPKRDIVPDIDLGGEYEDPGVSRQHLRFDRLPDGSYAVVDCGSANGTTVNDDPTRIPADTPVPLDDGSRVHLGAWTTITIERQDDVT